MLRSGPDSAYAEWGDASASLNLQSANGFIVPRYSDVAPASEEVLAAIPSLPCPEDDSPSGFVKVRKESGTGLRITMGKLCFESDSFTPETIRMIMEAAGVL